MATVVEQLGYTRLWVAEHHGMPAVASSAPAVLIAHLAQATSTLRVGSGGVMLPNHSPLVVAEQFATLEALHPGRIDLGLGPSPRDGSGHRPGAPARPGSADVSADTFPDDVVELIQYLLPREGAPGHPSAVPGSGYLPEVWLLGSSLFSAQLAGMIGLPFSFAYHFAPKLLDAALETYRSNFRPSILHDEPRAMVAVTVLCAPTEDEARWLSGSSALSTLQLRTGRLGLLPSPEEAEAYPFTRGGAGDRRGIDEQPPDRHARDRAGGPGPSAGADPGGRAHDLDAHALLRGAGAFVAVGGGGVGVGTPVSGGGGLGSGR